MVGRTARRLHHDALKPQPPQIQLVDKHVDRPHRIVFTYVVVKELGQQNALRAVLALDKALIKNPDSIHQDSNPTNVFTQPASEIVGTVSPCLPGAASCESCPPRRLERFVGGESDLARVPRGEARQRPSRRPPLHQAQAC
jgi:hypothetical protein